MVQSTLQRDVACKWPSQLKDCFDKQFFARLLHYSDCIRAPARFRRAATQPNRSLTVRFLRLPATLLSEMQRGRVTRKPLAHLTLRWDLGNDLIGRGLLCKRPRPRQEMSAVAILISTQTLIS